MIVTGMAPESVWKKWPSEHITPMSTAMKAYEMVLDNDQLTGQVLELSRGDVFQRESRWDYPNSSQKWITEESLSLMQAAMEDKY